MKRRYYSLAEKLSKEFAKDKEISCVIVKPSRSVTLHSAYVGFRRAIAGLKLRNIHAMMFDGELRIVRR